MGRVNESPVDWADTKADEAASKAHVVAKERIIVVKRLDGGGDGDDEGGNGERGKT